MSRILQTAFLVSSLVSSTAWAQHDALVELYGEGVHRFFANDLTGADEILTRAIDGGSEDPRAYFFRGLARERAGYGGEMDFETGARLEAEGKRVVDVSAALARIQGSVRTKVEQARRDARLMAKQQQLMMQQAQQMMQPPAAPVAPAAAGAPAANNASPFPAETVPADSTGLEPAPAPVQPEVGDTSNPFADDAAPAPPAATEPVPAEPTPTEPAPAAPADPFGTPPATESPNPFGEAPAGGAAPPATDNPFGL